MNAIESLLSRSSNPSLTEPAPAGDELEQLFQAALRAPDHANLKPWRFLVFSGDNRAHLGELMQAAALKANPELDETKRTKLLNAPFRAPLVIAGIVRLTEHPKVPDVEQWLSTGAALTNMLNAAHALGYAAIWRSGDIMFNPHLSSSLGLADNEKIVGFVYIGTPKAGHKPVTTLESKRFFEHWDK